MNKTFEYVTDRFSDNSLEATMHNGVINITVENPWAGDTESGFGATCYVDMTAEKAREFAQWLLGVTQTTHSSNNRT